MINTGLITLKHRKKPSPRYSKKYAIVESLIEQGYTMDQSAVFCESPETTKLQAKQNRDDYVRNRIKESDMKLLKSSWTKWLVFFGKSKCYQAQIWVKRS